MVYLSELVQANFFVDNLRHRSAPLSMLFDPLFAAMHPIRMLFSAVLLLASVLAASATVLGSQNMELRATPTDPNRVVLELSSALGALKPKGSAYFEIL
jgi:hypothetical protein